MEKLMLVPDKASYTVKDGKEVVSIQLDGGAARYRRDVLNAASRVTCLWNLDPAEYQYFRAFYRTSTQNGSQTFLASLMLDEPVLRDFEAHFVPDSVMLREQSGLLYVMAAELEVSPLPVDDAFNQAVVDLWTEGAGDVVPGIANPLHVLVNIRLPGAIGL